MMEGKLPKYGATILLGGSLIIAGSSAIAGYEFMQSYRKELVRPYITEWQKRIDVALKRQAQRPELRRPLQAEILENIAALNTFDR